MVSPNKKFVKALDEINRMYRAGTFSYNMKKVAHAINEFQKANNLETFVTAILNQAWGKEDFNYHIQ